MPDALPAILQGPAILRGLAVLVFATVLLLFLLARGLTRTERKAVDRIQEMTGTGQSDNFLESDRVQNIASTVSSLAAPSTEDDRNVLRRQLIQAGWRAPNNLEMFSAVRVLLALMLPMLAALILRPDKLVPLLAVAVVGAGAGYYIPGFVLSSRVTDRHKVLLKPFPDALDLLVSSVEAGLGLDAAFKRVAEEMESAAPELARELQLVNHEVGAGVPRIEALRHLDQRTGLDDVSALCNVLAQAERFGTSVARALRVHSDMVRTKRMLAAEEQAAKVSPKLTVAMILFILPCLIIILIGPAVINVIRVLLPAMQGAR